MKCTPIKPNRRLLGVKSKQIDYADTDPLRIFTRPDVFFMRQLPDGYYVLRRYMPGLHMVSGRNKIGRKHNEYYKPRRIATLLKSTYRS